MHVGRYPSDVYDRYWYPPSQQKHLIPITTTLNVDTKNDYNPPETVMATAATPRDANASWTVEWIVEPPNTQCYPYVYFSELQTLGANETREFTMFLAGADFHSPISPGPLITTTIFDRLPTQCDGKCVLELTKTSTSTLPPVLSAIEVYTVMDFPLVETNEDDGTCYNLSRHIRVVTVYIHISCAVVLIRFFSFNGSYWYQGCSRYL